MNRAKYFLPLLVFVLLGMFLYRGIELDPGDLPSPLVGKPMPEFQLPLLEQGGEVDESALVGKPLLLNVWATWCVSCKMEHPYLLQLSRQGIGVVGLNYKDDSNAARQWLEELGNPYLFNIVDHNGGLGLDLGVFGAPETFIIDKAGIIRYKHVGVINERVWHDLLEPVYAGLNE